MLASKIREPVVREVEAAPRELVYRTQGRTHGPITRLMSPSDLGEVVKPFVFLDLAVFDGKGPTMSMERGWHPHSGIATVTVMLEGGVRFAETTGRNGVLPAGGVEFMRAGNGVWHTGAAEPGLARAFQLWIALPPELENGPFASQYLLPQEVAAVGPARVILGSYDGAKSPIDAPPMTYLHVQLEAGEGWSYVPADGHDVAWLAVDRGLLRTPSAVPAGQMAIFEPSNEPIALVAEGATSFVIGSAEKHPHPLVLGNYSVHTRPDALRRGEEEIRRIGRELMANGTLGR
jgi:redox-sensitive bicupin YhaK (pirin superfamily)